MPYIWQLKDKAPLEFTEKFPELPPTVTQLLFSRNLQTQSAVDEFFIA